MDVATLGLAIDSRQAVAAKHALDQFAGSGKAAAAAAAQVEKAAGSATRAQKQLAASTGLARHEMINLSRQVQDVGVSLVSGQSPLMVLAQQGTQIADIFGSSKGTLRGFASQITSVITPTRALGLGIGLAGAAAYIAYGQWKSFAKQLDDTARSAGETTMEMAKLQGAASVKGIDGEAFGQAIGNFSQQVYQARNGMGELGVLLRANGTAAKDFGTTFDRVADLIRGAAGDTQAQFSILRQAGLPATMEWVRLMSQGADGIRRAKSEMTGLAAANDELLKKQREIDEAWSKFWVGAAEKGRNFFVGMISGAAAVAAEINKGFAATAGIPQDLRRYNPAQSAYEPATRRPVDPMVAQARISREQATIALLGKTPTTAELAKQRKETEDERADRRHAA